MKRLSNEDGTNAGFRNIGRLALSSIPLVLVAAACVWLGFWISAHGFFNQLNQEERRAVYVGAAIPPKAPIIIETPFKGCVKVTRVDLDGSTAAVYFENGCSGKVKWLKIYWQEISPDGTKLSSGDQFSSLSGGPDVLDYGEKGEAVLEGYHGITLDKRTEKIMFWVEPF